jgi:two-component system, NarL family, nitrate/nitrite response regulator NarL
VLTGEACVSTVARRPRPCGSVLIVDDDDDCRSQAAAILCRAGFEVREARREGEALQAVRSRPPELVVLEVCLPGVSGYEVCRQLRDEFGNRLAIIFVSGRRTESFDRVAGLLLGADDYLVKPFTPGELLARVRALVRRAAPARPRRTERLSAGLTERELEVLQLLAEGLEQGEIAEWLVISAKTVGNHIERILGKLGVHSRAQAVGVAYREQLIATQYH